MKVQPFTQPIAKPNPYRRRGRLVSLLLGAMLLMLVGVVHAATWQIETVDSTGDVGIYTSLALDSSDRPHISYFDQSNGDLEYAIWDGSSWQIETVDSAGTTVGLSTSLVLDSSDRPHISYLDQSNGDLKYAAWDGSQWQIETVDSATGVGLGTSLALDSSGQPHISYYDDRLRDLKYAAWDGSAWQIETVDSAGDVGGHNSLALDSSDRPHISYLDYSNFDLKYAAWDGSAWQFETVDNAGAVGGYGSLALDSSDRPHISYYDTGSHTLKYAAWDGSAWQIQTVDSAGRVGVDTSLALDSSGQPHISYYDESNNDLKYAAWDGSAWQIETVDSPGDVGRSTSLELDSSGQPHISYLDLSNFDLKYTTGSPDSTPPVITPTLGGTLGEDGWYTSDVNISWTVSDDESAVTSTNGCDATTIDSDTAGATLTCEATSAGGTNSASVTVKRDATPPVVSVTGVTDGGTYYLGSMPAAGCDTSDGLSGVATPASLTLTGGNANGVGSFTATCDGASDNAGNTASASVTFHVVYDFAGFFSPIDNPPAVNQVKAGRTIPVKFSLNGDQGLDIFNAGYPISLEVACDSSAPVNAVEETDTAGNSGLSYDQDIDQYSYTWKTNKGWSGTCRQLIVQFDDGSAYTALFQFK